MTPYRVTWEIDIEADTPEEAARKALEIQRDPNSIATVFTVTIEPGNDVEIDLLDPECDDNGNLRASCEHERS